MNDPVPPKDSTAWLESVSSRWPHPNCFSMMKPRLVRYIKDNSLTLAFPVLGIYLNPANSMQGGFISAAFDNTFGFMGNLLTNRAKFTTLDLNTNYHRPIYLNDDLVVTVSPRSVGNTIVHLTGEAVNREGKLIATGSSTLYLFKND